VNFGDGCFSSSASDASSANWRKRWRFTLDRLGNRRRFGNVTLLKEVSREMWGWAWFESLAQDLRYALRTMRRSPGFVFVTVFSLALGIGAILLRSLPIRKPGELVIVQRVDRRESVSRFSYPAYAEMREKCRSFAGLFAFTSVNGVTVRRAGAEESARGQLVSGDFFRVLGVPALIGRMLGPEDDRIPGAHPVTVISHGYWKRRWAEDPKVLGQTLTVNGAAFTVVGITPPEFFGVEVGRPPDIWIPTMMQAEIRYRSNYSSTGSARSEMPWPNQPDIWWLAVMGRTRRGVAAPQAAAEASTLYRQLELARGYATPELRIELAPGGRGISELRRRFSEPLRILMGMVGLLLLVACANVANLLLARATARRHEIAVRLAIGAGRWRLVRQLLTESTLLALAGGGLGLALGDGGRRSLLALIPLGSSIVNVSIDLRVLAFTAALSLATGILFGLAPALQSTAPGLRSPRLAVSRIFLVGQVGLCVVLLIGAGLFARTLRNLQTRDTGYRGDDLLLVDVYPQALGYQTAQLRDLYDRLLERVRAIPGVRSASLSLVPPVSGDSWTSNVTVAGYTPRPDEELNVRKMVVAPEYFETVGLPLIEGRGFSVRDAENAPPVAVINQTMARYFFGERSAIGQRFVFGAPLRGSGIEIVGVVRDAIYNNPREHIPHMAYLPVAQQMQGAKAHCPQGPLRDLEVRTGPGAVLPLAHSSGVLSRM
jgi:predicted permease